MIHNNCTFLTSPAVLEEQVEVAWVVTVFFLCFYHQDRVVSEEPALNSVSRLKVASKMMI